MTHARVPLALAFAMALGLVFPAVARAQVATDEDGAVRALTPDEARALAAAMGDSLSQSDHGLSEKRLPDGTTTVVDLAGRFESLTVAKMVDGKAVVGCVTTPAEAAAFVAPSEPANPVAER
jgi:hypothetical protein